MGQLSQQARKNGVLWRAVIELADQSSWEPRKNSWEPCGAGPCVERDRAADGVYNQGANGIVFLHQLLS